MPFFGVLARGHNGEKTDNEIVMVVTAKLIEE